MPRRSFRARLTACVALAVATVGPACSDSTGPGAPAGPQFGSSLSLAEFQAQLTGAPRLEIKLLPGGLVAREVDVEPNDAEERIASRVTAIDVSARTMTLELGGLVVSYVATTRFRTPASSSVSRTTWETAVATALSGGAHPPVEARRNPGAVPQAPDDASFIAADLRLGEDVQEPGIEMYVGAANYEEVANPPPLAVLRVLDLPIQITAATRLIAVVPPGGAPAGNVEFEARIASVDASAGTMTLVGGTVIQAAGATFDPTGDLVTLASVAAAVSAGKVVRVEGRGVVQSAGPPATITATELRVEVDG
ncbi:MAG TPA: hypothetical protein VLE53_08150 [Gemmatimonadaceae bacterium]|nr:hypothetical protein [Gemmatimonadaceae bacterium]